MKSYPTLSRLLLTVCALGLMFSVACGGDDSNYYDDPPIQPKGQMAPDDESAEGG